MIPSQASLGRCTAPCSVKSVLREVTPGIGPVLHGILHLLSDLVPRGGNSKIWELACAHIR
jgi:hypothetical protein